MKQKDRRLFYLLLIVSVVTVLNMFSMLFLLPFVTPFTTFSAARFLLLSTFDGQPFWLLMVVIICVLNFIATVSVRKGRTKAPLLLLLLYTLDAVGLIILILYQAIKDYFCSTLNFMHLTINIFVIIFLYGYLKRQNTR